MPAGFMSRTQAIRYVMEKTGYGRPAVERKMAEMSGQGLIEVVPDPGRRAIELISEEDVEKVVEALTLRRRSP